MKQRSILGGLSGRIVTLFLGLLLVVQLTGFVAIRHSIDSNARAMLDDELVVGERVMRQLLDQNAQKLAQGAGLLAADYAFRTAVQSDDSETVRSALDNHGARIGSTVSALLDTGHRVRAVSEQGGATLAPLLADLTQQGSQGKPPPSTQLALVGGQAYQFVVVPMKAPLLIGWVVMGFALDQALADDLRALSGLHMALVAQSAGTPAQMLLGTLPSAPAAALAGMPLGSHELTLAGEVVEARGVQLMHSPAGELRAVLLRSIDEAVAPYRRLQALLAGITVLGVAIFGLGSVLTARRVTRPVRTLVQASRRLGEGDFDTPVPQTGRDDEIGDLAQAFEQMRNGIAEKNRNIRRLAYWDTLTGLPNRAQFTDALDEAIAQGMPLAVLMLDLDRVKQVNDKLGYHMGDRLLQQVAERLFNAPACAPGLVARLSGDEFAVMVPQADVAKAMWVAGEILRSFEVPVQLEDSMVDLAAGVGIACHPEHAPSAVTLLSRAEVAMYEAKHHRAGVLVYDPAIDSGSAQTLSLLTEMRRALHQGELRLFLQPKLDVQSGRLIGAEALVRWQHPGRGLVPPLQFIPFAEETGFIHELTLWVLEDAARVWAGLRDQGLPLRISVNLSTHDLMKTDLLARLQARLARFDAPPEALCLEITESAIMSDPQRALQTLQQLSSHGFKLSIDDFGAGYSSYATLKNLPVHELKIDMSFVRAMEKVPKDAMIVRSIIEVAHNLSLSVVAEGVENETILQQLRALGCDEAQGYHIGKPMPSSDFAAWALQRAGAVSADHPARSAPGASPQAPQPTRA